MDTAETPLATGAVTFPLDEGYRITADFQEPRRSGRHEGWDLAPGSSTRIIAPEAGTIVLHAILRGWADQWRPKIDQTWPDGSWYPWSNYYVDTYGGIVLLLGATVTWVFCHIDIMELGRIARDKSLAWDPVIKVRAPRGDRYEWIRAYLTCADPFVIREGDTLTQMGTEGVDTGLHLHMEVHPPGGRTWQRLDPAVIFPDA